MIACLRANQPQKMKLLSRTMEEAAATALRMATRTQAEAAATALLTARATLTEAAATATAGSALTCTPKAGEEVLVRPARIACTTWTLKAAEATLATFSGRSSNHNRGRIRLGLTGRVLVNAERGRSLQVVGGGSAQVTGGGRGASVRGQRLCLAGRGRARAGTIHLAAGASSRRWTRAWQRRAISSGSRSREAWHSRAWSRCRSPASYLT